VAKKKETKLEIVVVGGALILFLLLLGASSPSSPLSGSYGRIIYGVRRGSKYQFYDSEGKKISADRARLSALDCFQIRVNEILAKSPDDINLAKIFSPKPVIFVMPSQLPSFAR